MGILLLEGGSEFQGKMEQPDRRALALAGGVEAKIAIIPTAAAPHGNSKGAGNNGLTWFRKLGARHVVSLPIVDKKTADDAALSAELKQADLIFILGGFPGYLENTLRNSRSFDALWHAYQKGAVLAGSSAGAMVLCEWYFDPAVKKIKNGFGFLKAVMVIPHHDTSGSSWRRLYFDRISDVLWVGIDEETGMINPTEPNCWTVYGKGGVTVYGRIAADFFRSGQIFRL